MIELIFTTTSTFEGRLKKQKGPRLHVFLQILKEKKHDDLFSKSKKSLLRNTKSNKLSILGVQKNRTSGFR